MTKGSHWLTGRVAVVTGASRGIGAAIAAVGAHVVLADRDDSALNDLAQRITASGGKAASVPTDVGTDPAALVCAAGVQTTMPFAETTCQAWTETLEINLTGSFLCRRAAFTAMRAIGEGRIINIASSSVHPAEKFPDMAAYVASKHRGCRPRRSDRSGRKRIWNQRYLHKPRSRRHPDVAAVRTRSSSRSQTPRCRHADRSAAGQSANHDQWCQYSAVFTIAYWSGGDRRAVVELIGRLCGAE